MRLAACVCARVYLQYTRLAAISLMSFVHFMAAHAHILCPWISRGCDNSQFLKKTGMHNIYWTDNGKIYIIGYQTIKKL